MADKRDCRVSTSVCVCVCVSRAVRTLPVHRWLEGGPHVAAVVARAGVAFADAVDSKEFK